MRRFTWFNATSIALGFAFLYIPILLLVIYSFNESKLVTVWGGWSTKWYASLLENEGILNAAWVTLRVAIVSSTLATVLGTLAAIVLVRMGRFPGRTLFSGMIFAPLVMPEVITGLSLLLLFVAINLDRGFYLDRSFCFLGFCLSGFRSEGFCPFGYRCLLLPCSAARSVRRTLRCRMP